MLYYRKVIIDATRCQLKIPYLYLANCLYIELLYETFRTNSRKCQLIVTTELV